MSAATSPFLIRSPQTSAEWESYYALRYRVLRAPWGQSPGSERAPDDDSAYHLLALTADGVVVGVARLHLNSVTEGQIRFMAVAPDWQGQGVGARLLAGLEAEAGRRGTTRLLLDAREAAVGFYSRLGYQTIGPGHLLFGQIPHWQMAKNLPSAEAVTPTGAG